RGARAGGKGGTAAAQPRRPRCETGLARLLSGQQLVEPLEAFVDAVLHPGLDHPVTVFLRLEPGQDHDSRPSVLELLEVGALDGLLAGHPFPGERADDVVRLVDLADLAEEGELLPVRGTVD